MSSDLEILLQKLNPNGESSIIPPKRPSQPELLNTPQGRRDINSLLQSILPKEFLKGKPQSVSPENYPPAINAIYSAINEAEMHGQDNHWIRTKHKPEGDSSTAFGPLQLTKTLAEDYLTRKDSMFTDPEKEYLQRFVLQGNKFLDHDRGRVKDERYGYGGVGELNDPEDAILYENVTKKMLTDIYRKNKGDLDKVWREWRFGHTKKGKDKRYQRKFFNVLANMEGDI